MPFKRLATTEVSALVERLVAAMEAEVNAATKTTQATADTTLAEARAELEQVTAALKHSRANEQSLLATIDEVRAEVVGLRTLLQDSQAEKQLIEGTLEKACGQEKALQSTIQKMQAEEANRREKVRALDLAVQKVRDRCAVAEDQLEKITAAKVLADGQHQKAQEAWLNESRAVREAGAASASADVESLRTAFQRLDAASTVTEALNALVSSLAATFPRVALFHVNGDALQGRHHTGFDFENDISKVVIPLAKGSVFHEAVNVGRTRRLMGADLPKAHKALFGGAPSMVLILPIVIAGTTGAVLYADDSGQRAPQLIDPQRVETSAEILLLHSMPLLARLSAQDKLAEYERQFLNDLQIVE